MAPEHADELDFHREQRTRVREFIATAQRRNGTEAVVGEEVTIVPPTDADYALPSHFNKTVPGPALRDLRQILDDLREYREGLVGLTEDEALVIYNGDEIAMALKETMTAWMLDHIRHRLSRPTVRGASDPFSAWGRLMDEFVGWFAKLAYQPGTGHAVCLAHVPHHVAWALYQATWAPSVVVNREQGTLDYAGLPEHLHGWAHQTLLSNGWDLTEVGRGLIARTAEVAIVPIDATAARAELKRIAEDLVEAKGLLVRHYRPEDHVVAVGGGHYAAWTWETGHKSGSVHVGDDPDVLRERFRTGAHAERINVDLDGRPLEPLVPWIDLGDDVLPWLLGVLRPLQDHLLDAWARAERPARKSQSAGDAIADAEIIAAACEAFAEADEPVSDDDVESPRAQRVRVPAVRENALLAMMARHFDCEVKNSKGSEVTVYRVGWKKFTLGAKRRGQHMPQHVIVRMLKHLGIRPAEFAAVAVKAR